MAVNISVKQFNKKSLMSDFDQVLTATGMDLQLLKLEITESIAMDHLDKTIDVIMSLAEGIETVEQYEAQCYLFNRLKFFRIFRHKTPLS